MLSVAGTRPTTWSGSLSCAAALTAEMTMAPPVISVFISSMPSLDLRLMPPVSKVIAFPMSATVSFSGSPHSIMMNLGGSSVPWATARKLLRPSLSASPLSNTWTLTPSS